MDFPASGGWSFWSSGYANTSHPSTSRLPRVAAPSVLTGSAPNQCHFLAAQLRRYNNNLWLSTTSAFDYGQTTSYGQVAAGQSASGSTPLSISATSGLTCNTLYHFRARVSNSGGTAYGERTLRTGNCAITFHERSPRRWGDQGARDSTSPSSDQESMPLSDFRRPGGILLRRSHRFWKCCQGKPNPRASNKQSTRHGQPWVCRKSRTPIR